MSLTIQQNTTGYVNVPLAALDTGWTISGIYGVHSSCVSGNIKSLSSLGLIVGRQYTITYQVDNYVSGGVKVLCGATNGTNRTANGTYTETLTCTTTAQLSFYSDGALRISLLKFYDTVNGFTPGTTISFNEGENKWGSDYSFHPELFIKFLDQFISVKNGGLWLHNVNPIRGNFYGQQYPATVTIVVNENYEVDKLFYNIRLNGKGKWYAPSLTTPATNQFPHGMLSRLKKNNFSQIDGKLFAEILRDITDPNFATAPALNALFDGRQMQGPWLIVQFQCDDTGETDMSSLQVYYDEVFRTF